MANYGCFSITAKKDENIVPLVFKEFAGGVPTGAYNKLKFIGFEGPAGTTFKLNGTPNKIPTTGKFITPYEGDRYLTINSLTFDDGCSDFNVWVIF